MTRTLRRRLADGGGESGLTLVELLLAATMSVVLVGASTAMLISAVRDQPALSKKAQNVTTARWQLERIVREIRNGVSVEEATPTRVSLIAWVRRTACGGTAPTDPEAAPIKCRITYSCATGVCTRTEGPLEGAPIAAPTVALSGVGNPEVFCFVPSTEADPTSCGSATESPTYVGVQLEVPNPSGPGLLTISDGANLRSSTLLR